MTIRAIQLVLSPFLLCVLAEDANFLAENANNLAGTPNAQYEYTDHATKLHKNLMDRGWNPLVPPRSIRTDGLGSKAGTDVHVQLRIFKVDSLDQSAGHLTIKCWLRLWWTDKRLEWNPEDFGDITETQFKEGQLWQPDVQPYNVRESAATTFDKNLIRLRSNGNLYWSRPGLLQIMCKFSGMIMFPFDTLSCLTEFGGWTMGGVMQGVQQGPPAGPDCLQAASGGSVEATQLTVTPTLTLTRQRAAAVWRLRRGRATPSSPSSPSSAPTPPTSTRTRGESWVVRSRSTTTIIRRPGT